MKVWTVVDRIEGKVAVLVFDEGRQQLDLPVDCLPGEPTEGSVYRVEFIPDENERARRVDRIKNLQRRLRDGGRGRQA